MSYQFLHLEAYGREGAHRKNSTARKSSMFDIRDEMIRIPHACSHVVDPLPPLGLFGMEPEDTFALANERAGHALDKKARKLRCDAPVVIAGVASWPEPVVDINNDREKLKRYQQWRGETVGWLQRQWGHDLKTVLQHLDEAYPHVHFVIVPKLTPDRRLLVSSIHPGHQAAERAAEAGGTGRDRKNAYKKAMAALQDDYYERVGARFGLLRIGPRLQHLTRREWKERKRQAELLAQAHNDVQAFAHNVKAIAKSHIAARRAEADQAAQAKIDAITIQSHRRLTRLKQKAMRRITDLKGRVTELEGTLSDKDATIAAQAAELETIMIILLENGLEPPTPGL